MATVTKKEIIDKIARVTGQKQTVVKETVQAFLDEIVHNLGHDDRMEFRDFGVFEVKHRQGRPAQNPRTGEPVWVPPKRSVKFKPGRLMKRALEQSDEAEEARDSKDGPDAKDRPAPPPQRDP